MRFRRPEKFEGALCAVDGLGHSVKLVLSLVAGADDKCLSGLLMKRKIT